jgi:alcohol dehydrogenase
MVDAQFMAWTMHGVCEPLRLESLPVEVVHPRGVLVRIETAAILSYMGKVLDGSIPYALPPTPFVPGSNAVGVVQTVGAQVSHVAAGDRVFLSPHVIADDPVPAAPQILIGLTALGASRFAGTPRGASQMQELWRHGTFAEVAHWPASAVTRLPSTPQIAAGRWIALAKLAVPYGGLLRGGARAGQVVGINGATGYYGSAGVMVALAMGAARVVAIGRDGEALAQLRRALGDRVVPAVVSGGDGDADVATIKRAADGALDVALDMLGNATSTRTTLATLRSLQRGGRLVVMGSSEEPLPLSFGEMLSNDWEVVGNFMYPKTAPQSLAGLVASGVLDLSAIRWQRCPFDELPRAIEAAASMRGLDLTALDVAH